MAVESSRIRSSVDLEAPGRQQGYLSVPHSRNDSAWGSIQMPITCVTGGEGPTVLFCGGNHGDEYEGPIALMKLADWLQPEMLQGRVIILPTLNHPAVCAGTRLSPIDGLNMNRIFPGRRSGTTSEIVAHYVFHHLVAQADVVVDLHSGGKTLDFVPSVIMHHLPDTARHRQTLDAITAFGAPVAMVLVELDNEGMLDTAVEDQGKLFISTELGGGGSARASTVGIADAGVRNLLCHFGLLGPEHARPPAEPSRIMYTPEQGGFIASRSNGIAEFLVDLGEELRVGQPICQVHHFQDVDRAPTIYESTIDGLFYCRHVSGLVQRGDCLAVLAVDYEGD